ncbi:hypothetical protein EJF18_10643 [Clavispora lusitaniae]|uniref:Uncharacterized protein n=1 Tax=Clavispora lusitaniae TaxID=36911 RepID=A0ACD0WE94_CLALS|nr:hypothetical protein EJF14_10643 [Clavispora lusitaniae]QFZ31151.1 hypothetical protein EJF16_10643 [Clavispora lusitaniae]QFZ36819.1 hypothetical protein EJF15_10643 [Clavispora lusitaniae]QFZ42503.1 hypothetical protein EJF18_10643 [Clavispora lusitaniae]QFZ48179.1 hypothetical protein EJF17_10643 [Clavispora lusitaniae]
MIYSNRCLMWTYFFYLFMLSLSICQLISSFFSNAVFVILMPFVIFSNAVVISVMSWLAKSRIGLALYLKNSAVRHQNNCSSPCFLPGHISRRLKWLLKLLPLPSWHLRLFCRVCGSKAPNSASLSLLLPNCQRNSRQSLRRYRSLQTRRRLSTSTTGKSKRPVWLPAMWLHCQRQILARMLSISRRFRNLRAT